MVIDVTRTSRTLLNFAKVSSSGNASALRTTSRLLCHLDRARVGDVAGSCANALLSSTEQASYVIKGSLGSQARTIW